MRVFVWEPPENSNATVCKERPDTRMMAPSNAHPSVVMEFALRSSAKEFPLIEKALNTALQLVDKKFSGADDVPRRAQCIDTNGIPCQERPALLLLRMPSKYERLGDVLLFPNGAFEDFNNLIER